MVQENKYTRRHGPDDRGPARPQWFKKCFTDRRRVFVARDHAGKNAMQDRRACFYGPGPARHAAGYPRRVSVYPAACRVLSRVLYRIPGPDTRRRMCFSWTGPGLLVTDRRVYNRPRRVFQSWTIAPGLLQHTGTACGARMFITAAGPRHGGRPGARAGIIPGPKMSLKGPLKLLSKLFKKID